MIKIKLLENTDMDRLFEFEVENRSYFQRIGLGRAAAYYDKVSFEHTVESLIYEQKQGIHYMYLVINAHEHVVGRVNLTEIVSLPYRKAELGYRIGEVYQGNGYATNAVKMTLENASSIHKLHRIVAGTSPHNIASQLVLRKNQFQFVRNDTQYIVQEDHWVDSLLFERIL